MSGTKAIIILVELSKKIRPIAQVIIEIWSRHTVVCRAAQESRARKRSEYIDRNNKVSHLYLCDGLSKWHQIYSGVSLMKGMPHFKFQSLKPFLRYESAKFRKNFFVFPSFSSSSFCTLCKNHHNSCVRALILLKFGTRIGGLKANTSINFG